jgi:hypothetical protein
MLDINQKGVKKMTMKKLADSAMENLNNRMDSYKSLLEPTDDEVSMAAMTCRIMELEEALLSIKGGMETVTHLSDFDLSDDDCDIESTIMETIEDVLR